MDKKTLEKIIWDEITVCEKAISEHTSLEYQAACVIAKSNYYNCITNIMFAPEQIVIDVELPSTVDGDLDIDEDWDWENEDESDDDLDVALEKGYHKATL